MRIVAWNCCERFDRKYQHLRDLDFDVAVVSECGPFDPGLDEVREVSAVLKRGVDQPGHSKHIGVIARAPWRAEALPLVPDQPWLVPVRITGPLDFTVLAVWALGPEWVEGGLFCAAQTGRVASHFLPIIDGPVVLAGDLNAPISSSSSSARGHADNVERMLARGLVSAYTAARAVGDPLTEPTFYHQRKATQPFHIDYVFVPKEWTSGMQPHGDVRRVGFNEAVGPRAHSRRPLTARTVLSNGPDGGVIAPPPMSPGVRAVDWAHGHPTPAPGGHARAQARS